MKGTGLFLLMMVIWTSAQVLMKAGMNGLGDRRINAAFFIDALSSLPVFLGLLLSAAGALVWLVILSRHELSYANLMISLTFALIVLASIVFFGEHISLMRWIGTILIIAGVYLVSRT